jgi:hypothetical protein
MAPALNIAGPDRKYVPRRSDGMVPVMEDGGHSWYGSSWNGVEYPLAYASMSGVICLLLSGPDKIDCFQHNMPYRAVQNCLCRN